MGIHSHIAVQLSLIGQSQSHGSKSAYCPRSRGLCPRRPRLRRIRLQLCPRPCLPPCWRLWIQQVRPRLLLHRQVPPGSPQGAHSLHKRQIGPLALIGLGSLAYAGAGLPGLASPLGGYTRLIRREAEPSYAPALAYHPAGGHGYNKYGPGYSYTDRSPQGIHKREAEPSYAPALAYHPAGGYGYNKYGPGYSYTDRSPQGIHKREAEPSYDEKAYTTRSPQGIHK